MTAINSLTDSLTDSLIDGPVHAAEAEALRTARHLRLDFAWRVSVRGGLLTVELDEALSAVELPEQHAVDVLARLRELGLDCPAVLLPVGDETRCVLFFRPGATEVPGALPAGHTVALPPSALLHGESRWLSSPWQRPSSLPAADLLTRLIEETASQPRPARRRVA